MRISLFSLLGLLPLLGPAGVTHAHMGDEVYLFYELLDEDLRRIDLTDGSVDDWLEVLGEPSLTAIDFHWPNAPYDPSNVDNRFWLAWHRSSGTLWVAMERFDDVYFNNYGGEIAPSGLSTMFLWDSHYEFMIDGDHSGGQYWFMARKEDEEEEARLMNNRHAQRWMAIAETSDGQHLTYGGAGKWATREPYAAAGGGVFGASPATTVTELKVTAFDDLIYNDEAASKASELYPGKVIGFTIHTADNDDTQWSDGMGRKTLQYLSGGGSGRESAGGFAERFADGLLVGAGEDPSRYDGDSAVEPSSWARIKASFE